MKPRVSLSAEAITARLREASARADLRPGHRLDSQIGLDAASVTARLRLVSSLRDLCLRLGRR